MNSEFSFKTRSESLRRFRSEIFDLLIIGGGITGAACARDATSRGLRVALVEKNDFASGTSSASSKLIHGGLRYLENFEFKLVFEALSERAHLVRTSPNMVRWLKFYLPVYDSDRRGRATLSAGLWLYDLLALGRAPHFHKRLSREELLRQVPGLKEEGLVGGFSYYDASMWDDVMTVENARAASSMGAAVANYVEARTPVWEKGMIRGFHCLDRETGQNVMVLSRRTVVCAGPYTDLFGESLAASNEAKVAGESWKGWLEPSRGVHLVFDQKRFPMNGAMLMTHPGDGRVSFVIPRADFGSGVVIVGTTDAPSPKNPEEVKAEVSDEEYLLDLLSQYFPAVGLRKSDVISSYVGIRPLVNPRVTGGGEGKASLQKVSREHHIGRGPGGTIFVAGGKYTTARLMAMEIIDVALKAWEDDFWKGRAARVPPYHRPQVDGPVNIAVAPESLKELQDAKDEVPAAWVERYGADALMLLELQSSARKNGREPAGEISDPEGFPGLQAQFRYALKCEMVLHLEDFYFRRQPLYLSRKDHGVPWAEALSRTWAQFFGRPDDARQSELARFAAAVVRRESGYRG